MYDDGNHGDKLSGDGVYGALFEPGVETGLYTLQFQVSGDTIDGTPFTRSPLTEITVGQFEREDINLDGLIDPQDVAYAIYYFTSYGAGPVARLPFQFMRADVNRDGEVDAQDILVTTDVYYNGNGEGEATPTGDSAPAAASADPGLSYDPTDVFESADVTAESDLWAAVAAIAAENKRRRGG